LSELDIPDPEARLAGLGYALPESPPVAGLYVPATQSGDLVFSSGAIPMRDGRLTHMGHVGAEVSLEEAQEAARVAVVNALSSIRARVGSLRRVMQVIKLTGYVASAPGFTDQPAVMDAASQLLIDTFGAIGQSARTAVGVAELPFGVPVEVDLVVLLR
jgi:enamine deaminase RidA (YjgF/YER057c/UK114 family)